MFCDEVLLFVCIAFEIEQKLRRTSQAQVFPSPRSYGGLVPESPIEGAMGWVGPATREKRHKVHAVKPVRPGNSGRLQNCRRDIERADGLGIRPARRNRGHR